MNPSQMYLVIAVIVLAVIVLLALVVGKKGIGKPISPLASFAFVFVLAGILFGENRWVGYGLMGIGVVLAVVDIVNRSKTR